MKRFEVGKTYFDTWACDSDSISKIKIVGRTEKMVTFERNGNTRKARIRVDNAGEYIIPDRYSMACVYRAEREYIPEEPQAVPAPAITEYSVSDDLLGLAIIGPLVGKINRRQMDFLRAIITGSKGLVE